MSSDNQQPKDASQEEERFWLEFDRQYFSPPHPSLLMCLKNHIWHTKHISSKIGSYLTSRKVAKKGVKKKHNLHLRSVKFPLKLISYEKGSLASAVANNEGIFRYFNANTISTDQIQGLLENDNVYKPLVSAKHDANQRLPTIYSSPLPDAIHLTLYIPPNTQKLASGPATGRAERRDQAPKEGQDESFANFVDSFTSVQLLDNEEVPQIISGPNPTWFSKGKGRFKRGVDLGPKYKKCDKLVKNPHGLLSDPVWQHFNTNYVNNTTSNFFRLPATATSKSEKKSEDETDVREGTDLLNYHNMCDVGSCRVDYSPLLFTFVSSKKSPLCKRCLGFPNLTCNLCKTIKGTSTAIFSSQYLSDEKYHMTYNLVDLFKLRSITDETIQSYYVNPFKNQHKDQMTYAIASKEELESKDDEDDIYLIYNYVQTLESLNSVFSTLLNRITNEYRPDTSRWHEIESRMLDTYIEQYNNKTLDNRYTYSVQRQSVDVLQLRLKVMKSADLPPGWTDRALCSICGTDDDWDDDPILFCDCCFIPMHFCCLGYKPGTLSDIKQKLNFNKLQRANYFNYLNTNLDKPVKKLKFEKIEDLMDLDEDEWYCPVCSYLMEQLSFLDENLVMAIIRTVGGPKNMEQLRLIFQSNAAAQGKASKDREGEKAEDSADKIEFTGKYNLPYILGFDYDNPLERVYISVHPTKSTATRGSLFKDPFKLDEPHLYDPGLEHAGSAPEGAVRSLERTSTLNLYDFKKEAIFYNNNSVTDPRNFCRLLLSKKGLYFEHGFWSLLSKANLAPIQEYLNYYSLEDLYLSRLVQQDKMIQNAKQFSKKRSSSIGSKLSTSRSLSLNSTRDFVPVKKEPEQPVKEEAPKKEDLKFDTNNTMHCKNPLMRLYVSINLRYLSNVSFTAAFGANATGTGQGPRVTGLAAELKKEPKEEDDVDIVVKLPVCIFCGFDAFIPGGGPMKRTSNSGTWGHIKCALANDCTIEPDEINYATFVPKIKALKCIFCNNWSTSVIQCSYGNCCKAFHVPCSSASPNCLFTWDSNGKPDVLCPIHSKGLAPTSLLRKLQLRLLNSRDRECPRESKDPAADKDSKKYKVTKCITKNKAKEKERDRYINTIREKDNLDKEGDKSRDKDFKTLMKGTRDLLDNVSINENLHLNHFLRPNYSNLSKLLEILLNEKAGSIFQSNLCSNYYYKDNLMRSTSSISVNSSGLSSMSSMASTTSRCTTNHDDSSSNDEIYKESDKEDDMYVPSVHTPKSNASRSGNNSSSSSVNLNDYIDKDVEVVIELDDPDPEEDLLLSKKDNVMRDPKQLLLGKDQLLTKHKVAEGRCPLNNINANNCFWCCLGFDLSGHNRHVFDDKTPSSKVILNILYNNNHHNINVIKSIINSKYDMAHEETASQFNIAKKLKKKDASREKEHPVVERVHERELKVPWNILSGIIMNNVVDEKINIYLDNDLINNNKLIKKNDFLIQKLASEALVRLFNTFEPDSTRYVIRTLFALMKHIDFVSYLDDIYGYNSIYYYPGANMESQNLEGAQDFGSINLSARDTGMASARSAGNAAATNVSTPNTKQSDAESPVSTDQALKTHSEPVSDAGAQSPPSNQGHDDRMDVETPTSAPEKRDASPASSNDAKDLFSEKSELASREYDKGQDSKSSSQSSATSRDKNGKDKYAKDKGSSREKNGSKERVLNSKDKNSLRDKDRLNGKDKPVLKDKERGNGKEKDKNAVKDTKEVVTPRDRSAKEKNGKELKDKAGEAERDRSYKDKLRTIVTKEDDSSAHKDKSAKTAEAPKAEAPKDAKGRGGAHFSDKDRAAVKEDIYKLLKEVNNVEIIKIDKYLLPSSILRKYMDNKKITICKVCLEFKYIENDIDNNKRKRNIYNESYRKCIYCNVEACNSCLSVGRHDFENLTGNSALIAGDYIGEEIDDFYFVCVRCKDLAANPSMPLLNCVLCSRFDGLLLKINSKLLSFVPCKTSFWNNYSYVHLICLEWLFWSKNLNNNSKKSNKSLFDQNCNYCGMLTGATITCSNTSCLSKFHPSCAAFLGCKIDVGKKNENVVGVKRALCLRHTLISICRSSTSERKFMVAPCYLYEVLVNNNYFSTFFNAVYLSPNCINTKPKLTNKFKIKKRSRSLDYKTNLSIVKMASYINYGLIINKSPQAYDLNVSESVSRDRLIQGMNYVFYQQNAPGPNNIFNLFAADRDSRETNMKEIKNIISLIKNGMLKPIQGSKRGRKPKSLDGSDSDKRHKMSMEDILKYGHIGILDNGDYYCPICFSIYFENSPGLPGDDLHWIGCDKCERWFHFVCAGVWVDYRDKDSWFCYHCNT